METFPKIAGTCVYFGVEKTDTHYMWMAQNNAVPEACDCAKKWVTIGLKPMDSFGTWQKWKLIKKIWLMQDLIELYELLMPC